MKLWIAVVRCKWAEMQWGNIQEKYTENTGKISQNVVKNTLYMNNYRLFEPCAIAIFYAVSKTDTVTITLEFIGNKVGIYLVNPPDLAMETVLTRNSNVPEEWVFRFHYGFETSLNESEADTNSLATNWGFYANLSVESFLPQQFACQLQRRP